MEIGHLGGWIWPGEAGTASFSLEAGQEQEFGRRGDVDSDFWGCA